MSSAFLPGDKKLRTGQLVGQINNTQLLNKSIKLVSDEDGILSVHTNVNIGNTANIDLGEEGTFVINESSIPSSKLSTPYIDIDTGAGLSGGGLSPLGTSRTISWAPNVAFASHANTIAASNTVPIDDTIPQTSETTFVISATITLTASSSSVLVLFSGYTLIEAGGANGVLTCVFNDQTTDAKFSLVNVISSSTVANCSLAILDAPSVSGAVTYSIRISGIGGGVTMSDVGGHLFGSSSKVTLTLVELPA